jgi:hypothetical protein
VGVVAWERVAQIRAKRRIWEVFMMEETFGGGFGGEDQSKEGSPCRFRRLGAKARWGNLILIH